MNRKKLLIIFLIAFLILPHQLFAKDLHFGIIDAIEDKIDELRKKLDTSPIIHVSTPSNGATVSGIIEIIVDVSDDNGIKKVNFYIDDILKSTASFFPYSYKWDTRQYSEGSHALTVKAYDTIGQTATNTIWVFVVKELTNFSLDEFWPTKIKLSWMDRLTDEDGFILERSTDGFDYTQITTIPPNVENYTDSNLQPNTYYYYRLRAFKQEDNGTLPLSEPMELTVKTAGLYDLGAELYYEFDIRDTLNHKYTTKILLYSKDLQELIICNYECRTPGLIDFTSDVLFENLSDTPFSYTQVDAKKWKLYLTGESLIKITYNATLSPIPYTQHGIEGLLSDDFFIASGEQYALVPGTCGEEIKDVNVYFRTKENWQGYTPWREYKNKLYDPFIYSSIDYEANHSSLNVGCVLFAPQNEFIRYTEKIGDTNVSIVLDKDIPSNSTNAQSLMEAFLRMTDLWGESIDENYLAFIVKYPEEVYAGEWTNSQGFSTQFGILDEMFVHQIYHRWNGWHPYRTPFQESESQKRGFYTEGWNVFYSDKILNELTNHNWRYLRNYYETYKSLYRNTSKDEPVAKSEETFIIYRKGALVAYMLDKEIQKMTENQKSLDDVVKEIWRRYGKQNGSFNYDNVIEIINSMLAGNTIDEFFNKYVFGVGPVSISEWD